jgi:hypothetical protein
LTERGPRWRHGFFSHRDHRLTRDRARAARRPPTVPGGRPVTMDIVAVLLGIVMFTLLLALLAGIDRI